jgi:hypothetical protein
MSPRMDQYKNANFQRKLSFFLSWVNVKNGNIQPFFSAFSMQMAKMGFKQQEKPYTESGKIATK